MGSRTFKTILAAGVCAFAMNTAAMAQEAKSFDVPAGDLGSALDLYIKQSGEQLIYRVADVRGMRTLGVRGALSPDDALQQILAGTNLKMQRDPSGLVAVASIADPQSASAAGDGADQGTVQALIVTAQKREENIQDVPIAMSAFTQEDLTRSQVAGGPDLITQVPNMTFTKTNFSSYSIQIRGIGTQAISATTDAAVAVAFNNSSMIRNRFFEQEFYDLQRIEVLRGPQGTLYGRNATAGVVNIISAKPKFSYEAKASADVGNYGSTRLEGMVNIPLVEDTVALRLAGAWTKRDGYATNEITGNPIDGRDLWSTRLSLRFDPTERFSANLIWEHFQEDDDRLRSGKQVCDKHVATTVGGIPVTDDTFLSNAGQGGALATPQPTFSQGCKASSMYAPESFQTPNGRSLPYYLPLSSIFLPAARVDPYVNTTQSSDLRVIESTVDPKYRAASNIAQVQLSFDVTDTLTLASETVYSTDEVFSLEDFNRFNTAPGAWSQAGFDAFGPEQRREGVLNDGVFCDPQLGCSDRLVAVDLSAAKSVQFSQELRLSSNMDGPLNFSLGANYLRYDTEDKYYVFINSLSLMSAISPYGRVNALTPYVPGVSDNRECLRGGAMPGDPNQVYQLSSCLYMDPNPIESLNDRGHNYFLSKNPYKLISYAVFGEAYYNLTDNLKVTAGLRWTVDKKEAPRIPSWLLASETMGYPVAEVIEQEWRKPTGRLTVDWKPDLSFTDETLLYGSVAHGYKAGGANPPGFTYVFYGYPDITKKGSEVSATRPKTFEPEYVNAFELGSKNTLLDGRASLNLAAFYYDYKGYQISEIVDRSAFNRNFDANVWGLEIEADWRPLENLRLGFKGGYEKTRLADGMKAVDLMDRTAGDPDWVVVRPFPSFASNCILPKWLFAGDSAVMFTGGTGTGDVPILLGGLPGGNPGGCELAYVAGHDPVTDAPYVDLTNHTGPIVQGSLSMLGAFQNYPGWDPKTAPNNGEGIYKDLSGKELPNAPHFTATLTADYTVPLPSDWLMTLHTDLYYQSEAWTRVFNTEGYDKLKAYTNVNIAAIFTNEDAGWKVMAYVKNVFDRDSITGAFLNSDDTGLTTNVFLTEPRLYGVRVTKEWTGVSPFGRFGERRESDAPYPITVELGGQVQRHDAPNTTFRPTFIDAFAPAIDPSPVQARDLDWGDGREIKLTYAPGKDWKILLGGRWSETSGGGRTLLVGDKFDTCVAAAPCTSNPAAQIALSNYGVSDFAQHEKHTIVDFAVGRDLGIGSMFSASSVSGGIRYATFKSSMSGSLYGTPDWDVPPEYFLAKYGKHHEYRGALDARREFNGAGPVLSWEAARRIHDTERLGHVDLDWSVTGGVLFGKQKTTITGVDERVYYEQKYNQFPNTPVNASTQPLSIAPRSTSVTIPTLGVALGLSYAIDRIKVGAGYSWERYFDAIDGGIATHKSYDRTIDGPYFKIAVGFGG